MSVVLTFVRPDVWLAFLIALSSVGYSGHVQPVNGVPNISVPLNFAQLQQQCMDTGGAPFVMRQDAFLRAVCLTTASTANLLSIQIVDLSSHALLAIGTPDQVLHEWQMYYPGSQVIISLADGDLEIPNPLGNTSEYWTDESPNGPDCGNNLFYVVATYFKSRDQFSFCVKKVVSQQEVVTAALRKLAEWGIDIAFPVQGGYYLLEPGAVPNQWAVEQLLKNPDFAYAVLRVLVEMSRGIVSDPEGIKVLWSIAPWDVFPAP